MIRTIIIDDEPLAIQLILEYLGDYSEFQIVKTCQDGFQGLKAIQEYRPDLIFLDVQMPKITGFEMLELLEEPPSVIFTTAFDEYAMKAFDAHAVDYLLKPFSKERFAMAIVKFRQTDSKATVGNFLQSGPGVSVTGQKRIVVKIKNEIKIIPVQDVIYLEADDDYVNIFTKEGKFLKNKTLRSFEMELDPNLFVRIHRSYMVKIGEITKIEPYEKESYVVKLKAGNILPVSKSGLARLKTVLGI